MRNYFADWSRILKSFFYPFYKNADEARGVIKYGGETFTPGADASKYAPVYDRFVKLAAALAPIYRA